MMNDRADLVTVSIGMPVYNGAMHMRVALDSLLAQTFSDFELILSDNASTDETETIAREYAARDSRIRYQRQVSNVGATNNFNVVLNSAKGRYYMWAAHDDIWEPDFLQEMVAQLERDSGVELAFCRFDNISFDGRVSEREFDLSHLVVPTLPALLEKFLLHHESLGKANLFYGLLRRQTIANMGGLKIWGDGVWGADMLYVFSILLRGRLAVSDRFLYHKRSAPSEASAHGAQTAVAASFLERHCTRFQAKRTLAVEWLGYWAGYERLLKLASNLRSDDSRRLAAIIRRNKLRHWRRRLKYGLGERFCKWMMLGTTGARTQESKQM